MLIVGSDTTQMFTFLNLLRIRNIVQCVIKVTYRYYYVTFKAQSNVIT